jgi:peptidoglycan/xylan/chitin deacetylase (PgdA/CDA1 family)
MTSLLFHDVFVEDPSESGFSSAAADRYKLSLPEFDAQLQGLTDTEQAAPKQAAQLTAKAGAQLTFDDGGLSFYTIVADRLEARGWRGHCFVSTDFIGRSGFLSAGQIRELDRRGHAIGTHSASHPVRFSALSGEDMRREWSKSRKVLEDLLGHAVTVGSVPGGYFSKRVARAATETGLHVLFNSEPTRTDDIVNGCTVSGRFVIRRGAATNLSRRLVQPAPWTRCTAWASWNAKALVKPLLGSSYPRVAQWIYGGLR